MSLLHVVSSSRQSFAQLDLAPSFDMRPDSNSRNYEPPTYVPYLALRKAFRNWLEAAFVCASNRVQSAGRPAYYEGAKGTGG